MPLDAQSPPSPLFPLCFNTRHHAAAAPLAKLPRCSTLPLPPPQTLARPHPSPAAARRCSPVQRQGRCCPRRRRRQGRPRQAHDRLAGVLAGRRAQRQGALRRPLHPPRVALQRCAGAALFCDEGARRVGSFAGDCSSPARNKRHNTATRRHQTPRLSKTPPPPFNNNQTTTEQQPMAPSPPTTTNRLVPQVGRPRRLQRRAHPLRAGVRVGRQHQVSDEGGVG